MSVLLLSTAGAATAAVIDFDNLPGGIPPVLLPAVVSPHATISTEQGAELYVFSGAGFVGTSSPNNLSATLDLSSGDYDADIYIDFTMPVSNVSLNLASDNDSGEIATLNIFESDVLSASLAVMGNGNFNDPIPFDLTAYSDVTRIELVNIIDEFGLSIDDIAFDAPELVPEPATALLMCLALAGAAPLRRRRV